MILSILFALNAHAIDLKQEFKGRWKRQKMPNHAVVLHPGHVKFRFCKKANITTKRDLGPMRFDSIGLDQYYMEFDLYTKGDRDPKCLRKGHHTCSFIIGQWDGKKDQLSLMVSCDESNVVMMYDKRLYGSRGRN